MCVKPMGVATYKTADEMPENLRKALPPVEELRRLLDGEAGNDIKAEWTTMTTFLSNRVMRPPRSGRGG